MKNSYSFSPFLSLIYINLLLIFYGEVKGPKPPDVPNFIGARGPKPSYFLQGGEVGSFPCDKALFDRYKAGELKDYTEADFDASFNSKLYWGKRAEALLLSGKTIHNNRINRIS